MFRNLYISIMNPMFFNSQTKCSVDAAYTIPYVFNDLAHWGRDKMAVISQTTFSNVFSWMKMYDFRLRFQWSLFLRFQLTKFRHSDNGLAPSRHALWLSGAIRRQWYGPTSAQMMACRLTAPSRHLNQCWLIIKDVLWHLSKSHFARSPNFNHTMCFAGYTFESLPYFQGFSELRNTYFQWKYKHNTQNMILTIQQRWSRRWNVLWI